MRTHLVPSVTTRAAAAALGTVLLASAPLASAPLAEEGDPRTFTIDLAGFVPFAVGGEVFGVGTQEGEVVHATLEVTLVVDDPGEWSMSGSFVDFPMGGSIGFSSVTEGWSGMGTFSTVVESDALNGQLAIPDGAAFYPWFFQWSGGTPFQLPGGGIGVGPIDGFFEVLTLTLVLAPCPNGDVDLPWTDLGGAIAGTSGLPVLSASGSLCAAEAGTIRLENALPNSVSTLVIGLSLLDLPVLEGVFVPNPDAFVFFLPVDGSGVNEVDFVWPAGSSGLTFWLQHWMLDPGAASGVAASNGLRGCAAAVP